MLFSPEYTFVVVAVVVNVIVVRLFFKYVIMDYYFIFGIRIKWICKK